MPSTFILRSKSSSTKTLCRCGSRASVSQQLAQPSRPAPLEHRRRSSSCTCCLLRRWCHILHTHAAADGAPAVGLFGYPPGHPPHTHKLSARCLVRVPIVIVGNSKFSKFRTSDTPRTRRIPGAYDFQILRPQLLQPGKKNDSVDRYTTREFLDGITQLERMERRCDLLTVQQDDDESKTRSTKHKPCTWAFPRTPQRPPTWACHRAKNGHLGQPSSPHQPRGVETLTPPLDCKPGPGRALTHPVQPQRASI